MSLPAIYVKLSSDLLNGYGVYIAMNQLRGLLKELLIGPAEDVVSRADLFVDFITDTAFDSLGSRLWIKKAVGFHTHRTGDIFTGFSIGLGGDISARLYNKTVEIEKIHAKVYTQIVEGKWLDKPVGSDKTVKELLDKYLKEQGPENSYKGPEPVRSPLPRFRWS